MVKNVFFTSLLLVAIVFGVSAQPPTPPFMKGGKKTNIVPTPDFLNGEKQINVVFDYSQAKYEGDSQEKYYKGKDKAWIKEWEGERRENNASLFTESLNSELSAAQTGSYPKAPHTIIVVVLDCKFGTYGGPFARPAKLKCNIQFVKTGKTETLASITLEESQNSFSNMGTPVDFDRIALAFSEVGKSLGKQLSKVLD